MNEKKLIDLIKNNAASILTMVGLIFSYKFKIEMNEKKLLKIEDQIVRQAEKDIDNYKEIQDKMSRLIYKIGRLEGRK